MTAETQPLRVVFLGSDGIALPLLESLGPSTGASVIAVFTQPDRAVGRGQKVQPNAIKQLGDGPCDCPCSNPRN